MAGLTSPMAYCPIQSEVQILPMALTPRWTGSQLPFWPHLWFFSLSPLPCFIILPSLLCVFAKQSHLSNVSIVVCSALFAGICMLSPSLPPSLCANVSLTERFPWPPCAIQHPSSNHCPQSHLLCFLLFIALTAPKHLYVCFVFSLSSPLLEFKQHESRNFVLFTCKKPDIGWVSEQALESRLPSSCQQITAGPAWVGMARG